MAANTKAAAPGQLLPPPQLEAGAKAGEGGLIKATSGVDPPGAPLPARQSGRTSQSSRSPSLVCDFEPSVGAPRSSRSSSGRGSSVMVSGSASGGRTSSASGGTSRLSVAVGAQPADSAPRRSLAGPLPTLPEGALADASGWDSGTADASMAEAEAEAEEQLREEAATVADMGAGAAAAAASEAAERAAAAAAKAAAAVAAVPAPPAKVPAKPAHDRDTWQRLLAVHPTLPPSLRREQWRLDQFEVRKCLHRGYASSVYSAKDAQSGLPVALKVYDLRSLSELNRAQLLREVRLHSALVHQHVVALYAAFQDGYYVVLAQEFCGGGNVMSLVRARGGRLTEQAAVRTILAPLLSVLAYLHARGITHRDIKPENLLLDAGGVLKLADFGLAIDLSKEAAVTRAGTLDYMAPEVIVCPLKNGPDDNKELVRFHYSSSVDSWSVGVMAYELVVGFPPFSGQSKKEVTANIMDGTIRYPRQMTDDARSFVAASVVRDPAERFTVLELLGHRWVRTLQRRHSQMGLSPSGDGSGAAAQAQGAAGRAAAAAAAQPPRAAQPWWAVADDFAAAQKRAAVAHKAGAGHAKQPASTANVPPRQAHMCPF